MNNKCIIEMCSNKMGKFEQFCDKHKQLQKRGDPWTERKKQIITLILCIKHTYGLKDLISKIVGYFPKFTVPNLIYLKFGFFEFTYSRYTWSFWWVNANGKREMVLAMCQRCYRPRECGYKCIVCENGPVHEFSPRKLPQIDGYRLIGENETIENFKRRVLNE